MISVVLAFLAAIPGIGGIVTAITGAFFNAKVNIAIAKYNVDRDVAVSMIESEAKITEGRAKLWGAIGASKLLTFLVVFIATPVGFYIWKVVFVDNIVGPGCFFKLCWIGETAPIKGAVGDYMGAIIYSLFGSTTALAAVQHWWTTKP